nr:homeobox-DDT domain protein RLT1 [Tanacetum cinerariifolium]
MDRGYWTVPVDLVIFAYECVKLYKESKKRKSIGNPEDIKDVPRTPSSGPETNQYIVDNPEGGYPQIVEGDDTAYSCLHSPTTTKETSSVRRSRKKKPETIEKCLTGKVLSMGRSGMMNTFTTLDPLKLNSQLLPLITRYHLKKKLSCEPTISPLNDEIDFRVSFDDFDDEDYT